MNQFEMKQRAYQSNLKNRALQVLLYLIDRANKEQTCFPAVPTIGRELHISISTVKRAMREKHFEIQNVLAEIDYDDPYKVLSVSGKNMGFYNC